MRLRRIILRRRMRIRRARCICDSAKINSGGPISKEPSRIIAIMRQMRILVGMKVNEEEGYGDRGGCPVKMIGLIK